MPPVELTKQQLGDLVELENLHNNIRAEIERAEAAGLDLSDYRAKLEQMEAIRQGLLKVYGGTTKRRSVG